MCAQVLTVEDLPEGKNKAIIHNNAGYVDLPRLSLEKKFEDSKECFEVLRFMFICY